MTDKDNHKIIGGKAPKESLSHEQRKEMMSLMKRMLPPIPSRGIVDIRFSFWLFRRWYLVFIFGKDTRDQFRSLDKGDMDAGLTTVAKAFTYIVMLLLTLILGIYALYLIKTILGIDIFPDAHLKDLIQSVIPAFK